MRRAIHRALWALLGLIVVHGSASAALAFDAGRLPFSLEVDGAPVPYRRLAHTALPGTTKTLRVAGAPLAVVTASAGVLARAGTDSWRWTAPETPGLVHLGVRVPGHETRASLPVFVLVPRDRIEGGRLGDYRIGQYPTERFRGLAAYDPPHGFIEVTEANRDTAVSPHFDLAQFLCKQQGGFPQYLALQPGLIQGLERVLERVNAHGIDASTLFVMSGYRTPHYNRAIGNGTFSRHIFGDAADIFVDESPRDGRMDDLDGNGHSDVGDAELLSRIVAEVAGSRDAHGDADWRGGIGIYRPASHRGAFVHFDLRGYLARWTQ